MYTGEHHIVTGNCSYSITSVQSELPSNCSLEFSDERPINVTDELTPPTIATCTSSHVCLKQKSGEVCAGYQCSHMCTGRQSLPLTSSHQTDQTVEEHHHSWPLSSSELPLPAQEDFSNDFSDSIIPEDDGWHNVNGGQQLAALLQPSEAESCFSEAHNHMYCHKDVVALDRGDLHRFTEPRETMPEAFCQSCVQETYPQRPGLQELVLSFPWKFWLCPRASLTTSSTHREHSIFEMGHLYVKPFVCHAPELQPFTVGVSDYCH